MKHIRYTKFTVTPSYDSKSREEHSYIKKHSAYKLLHCT